MTDFDGSSVTFYMKNTQKENVRSIDNDTSFDGFMYHDILVLVT